MTHDLTLAAQSDAWRTELLRTANSCSTYYAQRVPHWIAISNRICVAAQCSPIVGRRLAGELMYSARREIELRAEYSRRALADLAERSVDVPVSIVLVDCTRLAGELMRDSCRDVTADIERASRFVLGVDSGCVASAMSAALARMTDDLLLVVGRRPDFKA